jgi:hypothetical protein
MVLPICLAGWQLFLIEAGDLEPDDLGFGIRLNVYTRIIAAISDPNIDDNGAGGQTLLFARIRIINRMME